MGHRSLHVVVRDAGGILLYAADAEARGWTLDADAAFRFTNQERAHHIATTIGKTALTLPLAFARAAVTVPAAPRARIECRPRYLVARCAGPVEFATDQDATDWSPEPASAFAFGKKTAVRFAVHHGAVVVPRWFAWAHMDPHGAGAAGGLAAADRLPPLLRLRLRGPGTDAGLMTLQAQPPV
jgi:hypothetical protein